MTIEPTEYTRQLMVQNPRLVEPFNKARDLIEDAKDLLDEDKNEINRNRAKELLMDAATLVLRDPDMWDLKPYLEAEWTRVRTPELWEMILKADRLFDEGTEETIQEATDLAVEADKILFADEEKTRYPHELYAAYNALAEKLYNRAAN